MAILPITIQRIDVVTSHTASHRPLFHADGTITQCAYNLWHMYNYIWGNIIFVKFFHTKIFYTKQNRDIRQKLSKLRYFRLDNSL